MTENADKLKTEALKRADILNASAAWGSDWDAHLITSLVRRVDALEGELAALRREVAMNTLLEIDGSLYGAQPNPPSV
jgi:hypothetical protein